MKIGWKRVRAYVSLAACSGVVALLLPAAPAAAYPYTIQVTQDAPRVVHDFPFKSYTEEITPPINHTLYDAGKLHVVATPYRIVESMDNYDQYLVNVEVSVTSKTGAWAGSGASIAINPDGVRSRDISDRGWTAGRTLPVVGCDWDVALKLSHGFGPISAEMEIGRFTGCPGAVLESDRLNEQPGMTTFEWRLNPLKRVGKVELEVYVQVPKGQRPDWTIWIGYDTDGACNTRPTVPLNQCWPEYSHGSYESIHTSHG